MKKLGASMVALVLPSLLFAHSGHDALPFHLHGVEQFSIFALLAAGAYWFYKKLK